MENQVNTPLVQSIILTVIYLFLSPSSVCYRETGDDQLQAYCEEVAIEGRMTEELTTVFNQLKEKNPPPAATDGDDTQDAEGGKQEDNEARVRIYNLDV